jgi:DNA polymerase I-like protein with 3'-5' exonuclease and polymerase domains
MKNTAWYDLQPWSTLGSDIEDSSGSPYTKIFCRSRHECVNGQGMKSCIMMTIHDAVYVEAPEEEAEKAKEILKEQMEAAVEMPFVPLEVDIE